MRSGIPIDKLYLLNNDNPEYVSIEDEIRCGFSKSGIEIKTIQIDPFEYNSIFNKVLDTYRQEYDNHKDVRFHINITMGTSIVVGAVCSAAYSINADLYYVKEGCYSKSGRDEIIPITIDNFTEIFELKRRKQTLDVFRKLCDRIPKSNTELQGTLRSPASLSYHTRYLQKMGLIERKDSIRNVEWILTEKGEQIMKRL